MTRIYHYCFLIIFFQMLIHVDLFAQVPPNDLCQNAIELSYLEGQCIEADFSLNDATNTPISGCFENEEDVWFKVLVPNDLSLIVKVYDLGFNESPKCAVFTGACNDLTEYDCFQSQGYLNDTTLFILSDNALAGEFVYIRIFDAAFNADSNKICIEAIDFLDFNGICQNATELFYSSDICDPTLIVMDTMNFDKSFDLYQEVYCFETFASLWYKINIPAQTRLIVEVEMPFAFYDYLLYEIYTGACHDLNFIRCDYIQSVYTIGQLILENFEDEDLDFTIKIGTEFQDEDEIIIVCAKELTPVDNEICDLAKEVSFVNYPACTEVPTIEFVEVINEGFSNYDNCVYELADVWYTFDDGDTINEIVLNLIPSNYNYEFISIELYNGSDCENLLLEYCEDIILETFRTEYILELPDLPDSRWYLRIGSYQYANPPIVDICFSSIGTIENDDCLNAQLFDLEDDCFSFLTIGSSNSPENFCTENNDVWFKFIYDSEDIVQLVTQVLNSAGPNTLDVNFFRGDCDNLSLIECSGSSNSSLEKILALHNPDLIGQTIYMAVAEIPFNGQTILGTFGICPFIFQDSINDFDYCSEAKVLHMNNAEQCDSSYNLNFLKSRYSGIGNECHPSLRTDDMWFSFTVPDDGKFLLDIDHFELGFFSNFKSCSFYHGLCAFPELITCVEINDTDFSERFNLNDWAGQEIYLQLTKEIFQGIDYNICISASGAIAPANDDCPTALPLLISNGACDNPNLVNNSNAHRTSQSSICPGFANDVWFTFTVPESGSLLIECSFVQGSTLTDGVFALYTGSCDNLSLIACDDDSGSGNMPAFKIDDPALANQELLLQFWSYNGAQEGEFEICLIEPEDLIGDLCEEAIEVLPGSEDACYGSNESTVSFFANSYSGVVPDCSASISSDIWFKFPYKESERLVFEFRRATGSSLFDGQAAIYRADCDNLSFIACDDDSGPANMPSFDLETLIDPQWNTDQDFYVQFWDFNQGIGDDISFCLYNKDFVSQSNLKDQKMIVSPNPVSDYLHISFEGDGLENMTWSLYNLNGTKLIEGEVYQLQAHGGLSLDTRNFSAGTYIIKLQGQNKQWVEKFIKI